MNAEEQVAQLLEENRRLREENQELRSKMRLGVATKHITGSGIATAAPHVAAALQAAAVDKNTVDADLATATAWVGAEFMKVGKRFASGGMRDRDVPRKPGHTFGKYTLAAASFCYASDRTVRGP